MPNKGDSPKQAGLTGPSGLNAKTITGYKVYQLNNITVQEFSFSGGPQLIKLNGRGQVEIGGTEDWGTGTVWNL